MLLPLHLHLPPSPFQWKAGALLAPSKDKKHLGRRGARVDRACICTGQKLVRHFTRHVMAGSLTLSPCLEWNLFNRVKEDVDVSIGHIWSLTHAWDSGVQNGFD